MLLARLRLPRTSWLFLVVALGAAALLAFRPIADGDTGWHLALGRLIAHGDFMRVNALAWTQPKHDFYPTSWAFDLALYALHQLFGIAGVQLFVFLMVAICLVAVAFLCHREGHARWLVVPVALLLADRIVPRPHVVSWAVLATCLVLCVTGEGKSAWRRASCILFIALGSNFHAGAVFSTALVWIFCFFEFVRARNRHVFARELCIVVGAFLALMANPGGTYNVFYAVRHLSMYGTLQLTEFEGPNLSNAPGFFVMAPVALVAAALIWRKRPALAMTVVTFIGGGLFAVRLAFKFYLASSPAIAAAVGRLQERFGARAERYAALLITGIAVVSVAPSIAALRVGPKWDEQWVPVRAVAFAKAAKLDGHVWNGFNDGGYLEWSMPEVPAYQDARVLAYDAEFFHAQQRAEASAEEFTRYLRDQDVEWALTTNMPADLSGNGLVRGPDWALVYWDDLSEIYVRRDVPRFAGVIARDEYRQLSPWLSPDELVRRAQSGDEASVTALEQELQRFEQAAPHHPVGRLARCAVATRLKRGDAPQACAEARAAFRTDEMQALVDRASALNSER